MTLNDYVQLNQIRYLTENEPRIRQLTKICFGQRNTKERGYYLQRFDE